MKSMVLAFVALVMVLIVLAWTNGRFGNTVIQNNKIIEEKILYFDPQIVFGVGEKSEINLMGNFTAGSMVSFDVDLVFDATLIRIDGLVLNNRVFDNLINSNIDSSLGKIRLKASRGQKVGMNNGGKQKLATISLTGLKRGEMMITSGKKPEVVVQTRDKTMNENFTVLPFKVIVK